MKKCLIIFSIVFLLLAVAFGISVAVTGFTEVNVLRNVDGWRIGFFSSGADAAEGRGYKSGESSSETFEGEIRSIDIQLINSEATFTAADVDKATVKYTAGNSSVRFGAELKNGKLMISESSWLFFSFRITSRENSSKLEVTLPRKYYESVSFDIAAGKVKADGITGGKLKIETASGSGEYNVFADDMTVNTASGSIKVTNCKDSKARVVKISGASGTTDVSGFLTEKFSVETASGSVKLYGISGQGTVNMASGKMALDYAEWDDRLDIEAASGYIDIKLPEGSGAELNLEALSGSVSYDLGGDNGRLSGPCDTCETLGSGNIHDVDIELLSGNIDIHD